MVSFLSGLVLPFIFIAIIAAIIIDRRADNHSRRMSKRKQGQGVARKYDDKRTR